MRTRLGDITSDGFYIAKETKRTLRIPLRSRPRYIHDPLSDLAALFKEIYSDKLGNLIVSENPFLKLKK